VAKEFHLDVKLLHYYFHEYSPLEEGIIFPDTYSLPKGADEKAVIKHFIRSSLIRHRQLSEKIFDHYDQERWFRYLTIASVVEKESANKEEMPLVASVVYNRLKLGMRLQMDGTLNYGKYSHIKVTPKRIKEDTTHFNTYKRKGLPNYPVCNVSLPAIKAAIFPAKTNYLYFVKNRKGTHSFSRHYKTHLQNIDKLK
jgi:UPF0755 protein